MSTVASSYTQRQVPAAWRVMPWRLAPCRDKTVAASTTARKARHLYSRGALASDSIGWTATGAERSQVTTEGHAQHVHPVIRGWSLNVQPRTDAAKQHERARAAHVFEHLLANASKRQTLPAG